MAQPLSYDQLRTCIEILQQARDRIQAKRDLYVCHAIGTASLGPNQWDGRNYLKRWVRTMLQDHVSLWGWQHCHGHRGRSTGCADRIVWINWMIGELNREVNHG